MTNPPFVLAHSAENAGTLKFHFFAAVPISAAEASDGSDLAHELRTYDVREVDYILPLSNSTGGRLIRTSQALRTGGAGGVASNSDVWGKVGALRLEVFDGKHWTNAWGQGKAERLPEAARILLTTEDEALDQPLMTEVLIPAGHRLPAPESRP